MTVILIVSLHVDGFVSVSQTAAWLTETTSLSEEIGLHLSEPFALKSLLLHHRQSGTLSSGAFHRKDTRNRKNSACSGFFFPFLLSCPLTFFHFPFFFLYLQLLPAVRKITSCPLWPSLLQQEWKGSLSLTVGTIVIMTMRK